LWKLELVRNDLIISAVNGTSENALHKANLKESQRLRWQIKQDLPQPEATRRRAKLLQPVD
jgi:hypothetical protein